MPLSKKKAAARRIAETRRGNTGITLSPFAELIANSHAAAVTTANDRRHLFYTGMRVLNTPMTDMAELDNRLQWVTSSSIATAGPSQNTNAATFRRFLVEYRRISAQGTPDYEETLIKHMLDEEATNERVHEFEWERIPHIGENATARRKELPRELRQLIWGFALDSSIASDLFIRGSRGSYIRGITKVPDMLRADKWFAK